MADPRFFRVAGPFSLEQLAEISGSKIEGEVSKSKTFLDIAPLAAASEQDVSFIDNRRYVNDFRQTKAGAILTPPDLVDQAPAGAALLVSEAPYVGYAKLTQAFYPNFVKDNATINERTSIDPSARIGECAQIDVGVVISENAEIGDNCSVGANSFIGPGVVIGDDCKIGPNVTLTHCIIGNATIIHTGVRIGQDGFGFAPSMPRHIKVEQLGRVLIGNEIEIGANTTIDRGAGPDTIIGDGTKIDNLVQIGHNVEIGQGCFITAQNGISGSSKIGNYVAFGGQVGIAGHVTIGDGVRVAAQSGISSDVAPGQTIAGSPAQNARDHWKGLAVLKRLVKEKRGK